MSPERETDPGNAREHPPLEKSKATLILKWIQLDLFTGKPVKTAPVEPQKQQRITNTTRLALDVMVSIARIDRLQDTMKRVEALCEQITGIGYAIDLDERHRTYQQKRKQGIKRNIASEKKERKRGRPKGSAVVSDSPKLTRSQRNAEIRRRHFEKGERQADIVRDTGLSRTTISNIINRKDNQK